MKKFLCIAMCMLCLVMTGCSSKSGEIKDINLEQLQEKLKNKESFALVFTQPKCGYCQEFKEMLDTYMKNHSVTLYDFSIDVSILTEEEKEKLLAGIHEDFPEMESTPDLYYVKDGKIEEHVNTAPDQGGVNIASESVFDEWVKKHKLEK